MKSITFSYYALKDVTLEYENFSPEDKNFIQALLKDDEDKTDEDWELVEEYSILDLVNKYTNDNACDVEIESIDD